MNKLKEKLEEEKEWHALVTDPSRKAQFFHKLCETKGEDHSHVKYIKKKISKLVY